MSKKSKHLFALYIKNCIYLYYQNETIILKLNIMKTSNVTSETLAILAEYKNTSLADIKNAICGSKRDRGTCWTMTYAFSALMRLADEQGNFVGKIIEDAFNGKNVSEKQAWCVAFFAKNNGLINS